MALHTALGRLAICISCLALFAHVSANTDRPVSDQTNQSLSAFIQGELPQSRLAGEGLLRWFGFQVYEASLFVDEQFNHANPVDNPIALALKYKRSFEGSQIANRSADELETLGLGSVVQRKEWTRAMTQVFPNVNEGDEIIGILRADQRTQFFLNRQAIGTINDLSFGPAFFSIWLDERTSVPKLRAQLLKQSLNQQPEQESDSERDL